MNYKDSDREYKRRRRRSLKEQLVNMKTEQNDYVRSSFMLSCFRGCGGNDRRRYKKKSGISYILLWETGIKRQSNAFQDILYCVLGVVQYVLNVFL